MIVYLDLNINERTMDVMGVTPGIIRGEDECMCDESNGMVHGCVVGECPMASVVADAEYASAHESLEPPVRRP